MDFTFFKRNGATQEPLDSPATEDPQGINGQGSFLHPEAPTGTRFNRKLIMVLGAVAALVMIFTFMSALQPPKKLTPQEEAEAKAKKGEKQENYAPTPEAIQTAPDSYAALNRFEEEQQLKRMGNLKGSGPGQTSAQTGSVEPYSVGSVKNISPGAINTYNTQAPGAGQGIVPDREKELTDARKSPIRFPGGLNSQTAPTTSAPAGASAHSSPQLQMPVMPWQQPQDDQNMQNEKREFVENQKKGTKDFYVKSGLLPPLSKYELKAGAIIPGVMITGINSDLPGRLIGQVRENVYDTVSGRFLLIPQGTKVIGAYDSKVAYAQDRALIIWTRLIFPNGDSIDLEGMDGVDLSGYAGLKDKVNNHYAKLITGVVLSSILSATTKVAAGNNEAGPGTATYSQQAASGAAEQVANVGARITDKNLNVQPTIEIRPGMKFNVFVNKDLILRRYKNT